MPKPKSSAVQTCDICDFKVANSYIFKRHLHRCLSLHGVASKRSSPRNPIRLKGTEGLLSKESSLEDSKDSASNSEHALEEDPEPSEDRQYDKRIDAEESDANGSDISSSLKWGVADGKKLVEEQGDEEMTVDSQSAIIRESSPSTNSPSINVMPGAPYSRQYSCNECEYEGKSARDYLYHLRDVHFHKMRIYECKICNYASRYGNKVERHMSVHNKLIINMDDRGRKEKIRLGTSPSVPDSEKQGSTEDEVDLLEETEGPKVQPLKLTRLNIKMPFKVSGTSKVESGSEVSSNRSTRNLEMSKTGAAEEKSDSKDIYRMILAKDGSYYFQCRDCLYWASIPSSMKKHHALCHSRLLGCPHCSMTTLSQGIYYEHLITHEGHGYVKCPDCSYVTSAKSNYEKHRSFHNGEFPVRCTVCNFGADSGSKIKRHVAMQHTPNIGDEQPLLESMDTNNDADWADEEMEEGSNLSFAATSKGQIIKARNGKIRSTDVDNDDRLGEYRCPKCPMVCYRRGNFTRHLTAKHKFNQSSAAALSKNMESKLCKGLKRKRKMAVVGGKQMRLHTSENLKCSHCSYIAKWPSDLRRHLQVHTIIKRFKCSICANKYKYLGDLNVHMRRDHNMEPPENITREVAAVDTGKKASPAVFRCPICLYSTHSKAELEQHSRYHGNIDKTFQCRLCDYQTYWRGDVGRHLFRHHKIILSKEATEIGEYFIHRPDIKPLTKQGSSSRNGSLSPSPSPDSAKISIMDNQSILEFVKEATPDSVQSSTSVSKKPSSQGSVSLKEGTFVCEYANCDFKATTSDRMESHIAVHLNLKQFVCPTCGKRTNWKWDVVKHMNKVHQNLTAAVEDVITLSIEEAKATIDDYLTNFEKKGKDTMSHCSLCDFKSVEKNRVVRHMGTVHKNENGKVISQVMFSSTGQENFLESPTDREDGERRGSTDSGAAEQPVAKFTDPTPEELAKFEKPYACALCKKPGSSKGDVKKHYNYTHPYKDVRILYLGDGTEFNYYSGEIYQKISDSPEFADTKSGPSLSPTAKSPRADSKFSNPKMHGYVKPFKCSICGLRSNWKWDLKKHLRSKHPRAGGFVIMLSIEEASETYGRDCTPSHPKNEGYLSIPSSPSPSFTSTNSSPIPGMDQHVFKPPPNIKAEILDDSNDGDSQDEVRSLPSFFPQSPASSLSSSPRPRGRDRATFPDPTRRQWKCSGCNYISNWRRNMARHIHRKHIGQEGRIKVLPLHKESGDPNLKATFMDKYLTREEAAYGKDSLCDDAQLIDGESALGQAEMRTWQCPQCPYTSKLRTHIIIHMQQHEMKPFVCGVCNLPFMNRGPLHRHLQRVHKRSDYVKLCRVNITYGDEGNEYGGREGYINSYLCRLCSKESEDRQEILKHLGEAHNTSEEDNILKIQKQVGGIPKKSDFASFSKANGQKMIRPFRKFHVCTICPYRSQKKSMLAFHMSYHKPNPANRFKCKYCPYYVSALRLLHQHQRKWHKDPCGKVQWEQEGHTTPQTSPLKLHKTSSSPAGTPRRHSCEKCPYTTNSKNDFIYHKQFHRPKRTAEFKCEYCDYWVVHKRLLKQHMRLHTGASSPGVSMDGSPAKSLCSDPGLVYDPVELAELAAIKQQMISAKITASLSKSPTISPMKLASQCAVDDKPGYIIKNGMYRKLHKCRFCPYTNIRARNMQLHERMHGPRQSNHPLMKCPYCDYYVGSKGLLSHHMKVHQKNYGDTPENDADMADMAEEEEIGEESDEDILPQQKVDTLLQISRFKRFGCERCPYASAKRQHFERHLELHGSRQRYTCQYCDYSVPSNNLLLQHTRLHMMPNQNLLASQSITNLQHLSEVPADVALASALPPANSDTTVTISVIHDHLGLYENSIYDPEPKKLYRCDRCPYANVRRDYLLSHLKFHMVPSALACPYCDYSAPKQPLLTQHIRVHFCPLPELSEWLLENGQMERETSQRNIDLAEALKVAHEYQNQSKKKDKGKNAISDEEKPVAKDDKAEGKENIQGKTQLTYICQYCDREFPASDKLVKHELQHLIGNHFEATMQVLSTQQQQEQQQQQQQEQQLQNQQQQSAEPKENQHGDTQEKEERSVTAPVLEAGGETTTQNDTSKSLEEAGPSASGSDVNGEEEQKLESQRERQNENADCGGESGAELEKVTDLPSKKDKDECGISEETGSVIPENYEDEVVCLGSKDTKRDEEAISDEVKAEENDFTSKKDVCDDQDDTSKSSESGGNKEVTETQGSEQVTETQESEQVTETQESEQVTETQESEQVTETQESEQVTETQGSEQVTETQGSEQVTETQGSEQVTETLGSDRGELDEREDDASEENSKCTDGGSESNKAEEVKGNDNKEVGSENENEELKTNEAIKDSEKQEPMQTETKENEGVSDMIVEDRDRKLGDTDDKMSTDDDDEKDEGKLDLDDDRLAKLEEDKLSSSPMSTEDTELKNDSVKMESEAGGDGLDEINLLEDDGSGDKGVDEINTSMNMNDIDDDELLADDDVKTETESQAMDIN